MCIIAENVTKGISKVKLGGLEVNLEVNKMSGWEGVGGCLARSNWPNWGYDFCKNVTSEVRRR